MTAAARVAVGAGELDRARVRRRQPDHGLHASRRTSARPRRRRSRPRRDGDDRDGDRADQRHGVHVPRARRPTPSATSRSLADAGAVTPQATIFDFATPPTVDSRRRATRSSSASSSSADHNGTITGIRFYKSAANTGTHVGSLWTATAARGSRRRRSPNETASGWQTVTFATPGRRHRRHDLRRVLLRARGPLLGHGRRPRRRGRQRAAARARRQHAARTASTPTAPTSTFPTSTYERGELLGRRAVRRAAPGQVTASSAAEGGHDVGERRVVGARRRRPGHRPTASRRTSARPRRPPTVTGLAAGHRRR